MLALRKHKKKKLTISEPISMKFDIGNEKFEVLKEEPTKFQVF